MFNNGLDKIQKSLEDYLETKRQAFGRFYFISNDELLAILAQARNPRAVQPFLRKCFDALVALEFAPGKKSTDILAMISPKGERVGLGRNLKARGPVEEWLKNVEDSMKKSLRKAMKKGVIDYDDRPRTKWVKMHPGQVVMCGAQIHWSRNTMKAIGQYGDGDSNALTDWYDFSLCLPLCLTLYLCISLFNNNDTNNNKN
jgi:dynein heavy chain, axonemal